MPFTGATLDSATLDATSKIITCAGTNFGEIQAPVSDIEYSLTGLGVWTSVDSIDSWANLQAVGSVLVALTAGEYDIRITTSDNTQVTKTGAFIIAGAGGAYRRRPYCLKLGFGF